MSNTAHSHPYCCTDSGSDNPSRPVFPGQGSCVQPRSSGSQAHPPSSESNPVVCQESSDHGQGTNTSGLVSGMNSPESIGLQMANCLAVFNNRFSVQESSGRSIDDDLFYPVRQPIGYAVLLANGRLGYPGDDDALKVSVDLGLMSGTLKACGWFVYNPYPNQDYLGYGHFDQTLREIQSLDFAEYSCFMFYYSGHGNEKGLLLSDSHRRAYTEIIAAVCANNSLHGKPKIFIFDSCRTRKELSFFYKYLHVEIRKIHADSLEKALPPDTIVCFSATDGKESYTRDDTGSFYTTQLVRLLDEFWDRLTFTEIVILTHGWARHMAMQNGRDQQPVMYCSLNYLLFLCERKEREELCRRGRNIPVYAPSNQENQMLGEIDKNQCIFLPPPKDTTRGKGPQSSSLPANQSSDVVRDAARGQAPAAIEFKTKDDVLNNLPRLGQGVSIFVCYAPNPESPYLDPKERKDITDWYQEMIGHLIRDLERHGFTVISDIHLGDVQPKNWLQWYVSRIELCDYLIMVCSPAFKELFSCETPKEPIRDERASWFLAYRTALYAEILKEVTESPSGSKYVPVILGDIMSVDDSIPTLFAMAQNYQLGFVEEPRQFYYDKMGGFESLVCRMASIDRMKLAEPDDKGVHQLAPAYSQQPGAVGGLLQAQPAKRRRGHKQVPFIPTSAATAPAASQPPQAVPPPSTQAPPPTQQLPPAQYPPQVPPPPAQYPPRVPPPAQLPPPTQPPPPSSLPDRPPAHSVILWLCQRITNWKFFARYLRMGGAEIERISIDNREDGVVIQRFQMFESWKRHEWRPYTYQTLGDVLMSNESNRHLYAEFCQLAMQSPEQ